MASKGDQAARPGFVFERLALRMRWLKRLLTPPLIILASLLMWIEDSLWQSLKRITGWLEIIPLIRSLEQRLSQLPPYPAMIVFLLPMTLLFPLKLIAVYWAANGFWAASLALLATAKVLGTAIVARMYVVCQPKLMTIGWFRRVHDWLLTTRNQLYAAIRAMPFYHRLQEFRQAIKLAVHRFRDQLRGHRGIWVRWRAIRRRCRHRIASRILRRPETSDGNKTAAAHD